jgi:hypothetical protein
MTIRSVTPATLAIQFFSVRAPSFMIIAKPRDGIGLSTLRNCDKVTDKSQQ